MPTSTYEPTGVKIAAHAAAAAAATIGRVVAMPLPWSGLGFGSGFGQRTKNNTEHRVYCLRLMFLFNINQAD